MLMFWPLIPFISFGVNLIPLIEIDVKGLTTQSFLPEEIGFYWDAKEFPNLSFPPVDKKNVFFAFQFISFLCWNNQFSISTVELRIFKRKTVTTYVWRNLFLLYICFHFSFLLKIVSPKVLSLAFSELCKHVWCELNSKRSNNKDW